MPVDQCVRRAVISLATAPLGPGRWSDIPAPPSGPAAWPWPSAEIRDYCPLHSPSSTSAILMDMSYNESGSCDCTDIHHPWPLFVSLRQSTRRVQAEKSLRIQFRIISTEGLNSVDYF